ncbi:hypothetical protein FDG95_gp215 [Pectobacterium phage vB_PcaM_CBB]|uniref:Uncharacterized protein n=1 Tax=Pectobacterium phage vB_PcaM_CBB TaxID=2772511 RepID=A0A1L2CUR9_9CAUD|nr:hypothetical protein FDG95_gp215 [Pectobacterium phage vB_PcaM_CBB]AMM43780.1 hypothetical protein CBB_215 [Pectobacterium phage vB_PcaM_CBB]
MIPKTNSTEYQYQVLKSIREVHEFDSELSDKMILMSIFDNYRTGGGLRLSELGYQICNDNSLYEFLPVPIKKSDRNSNVYTSLDRICTTPYYVRGDTLYLSDDLVIAQLTFCCDDFAKLFAAFL